MNNKFNKTELKEYNLGNTDSSNYDIDESYLHSGYLEERPIISLSYWQILIPNICFCRKNKDISAYLVAVKYLENEMKISKILNKINQVEKIKENVLSKEQLKIFDKLYSLNPEIDKKH